MTKSIVSVIGAYAEDGSYGLHGGMPWPRGSKGLPGDMSKFKKHITDAPYGSVNLLICGKETFQTMADTPLGEKRVMVGVSRSTEPGSGYGPNRYMMNSVEDALGLAKSLNAYRIIYIGGEHFWLRGIADAEEVHVTIAHRKCDNQSVKKLSKLLHVEAIEVGMILYQRETREDLEAWSPRYEFQTWKK